MFAICIHPYQPRSPPKTGRLAHSASFVFQGNILSPLLFLVDFNPTIQSVAAHHSKGFYLSLPRQDTDDFPLPCVNSHIYTLWQEKASVEEPGWYLARIVSVNGNGDIVLRYRKEGILEEVNLSRIKWIPAKGNWEMISHPFLNSYYWYSTGEC